MVAQLACALRDRASVVAQSQREQAASQLDELTQQDAGPSAALGAEVRFNFGSGCSPLAGSQQRTPRPQSTRSLSTGCKRRPCCALVALAQLAEATKLLLDAAEEQSRLQRALDVSALQPSHVTASPARSDAAATPSRAQSSRLAALVCSSPAAVARRWLCARAGGGAAGAARAGGPAR